MKGIRSSLTLASIYIGTVIGAGFASGQEIVQFFAVYGFRGIIGVFIAMLAFSILGSKLLVLTYKRNINSLEEFLLLYFRKETIIYINIWLIFFLFISYFIMLAGSGAIFKEHFNINGLYGIIFMSSACFIVLLAGVKGIAKTNNILIPFLLVIVCFIGCYTLYNNSNTFSQWTTESVVTLKTINFSILNFAWLGSALLYVAFNSMITIVVFTSLRPLIENERSAVYGGILGGIGLGIMSLLILLSLLILYTDIIGLEIPMIAVAFSLGETIKRIYSLVLLVAMFTTAIANGYGCMLRISNLFKADKRLVAFFICITSIPMAGLGFKNLVSLFYPIFGYVGVIFFLILIIKGVKRNIRGPIKGL